MSAAISRTLALALLSGSVLLAHDIPNDVTVHADFKPNGHKLNLLVRVPFKALRDVDFTLTPEQLQPQLPEIATLWLSNFIEIHEEDTRLANPRVINARLLTTSENQLEANFEYDIRSDQSRFSIRPALQDLAARVTTALRFIPPSGAERVFEFHGDPGLVPLDPRWHQAAFRFVHQGFLHILSGPDHLLFLACLVIPFRRFRSLALVVTAFTAAHSITLIASAYNLAPDMLWFPPLVETLIAVSILYMALENIIGANSVRRRWIMAFCFGLIHGFGFSFALRDTLQFAGSHVITSLLSFNIGVELGQLLVLVLMIPLLDALFRYAVAERIGTIILSALVAHTAWHWAAERLDVLNRYTFEWPDPSSASIAAVMRWTMLAVAVAAVAWLFRLRTQRQKPHQIVSEKDIDRTDAALADQNPQ